MPWQSTPPTPVERDFCIRYYQWAQAQWHRELELDFIMLRAAANAGIHDSSVLLTFFEKSGSESRQSLTRALLKRVHRRAVAALEEPLSPDETARLNEFDRNRRRRNFWRQMFAGYSHGARRGTPAADNATKKAVIHALREGLEPILGPIKHDPAGPYCITSLAGWEIQTNIEISRRLGATQLNYCHDIRLGPEPWRYLARGICGLSWLGLGTCLWTDLKASGLDRAARYIAVTSSRFLDDAPRLLPSKNHGQPA